LLTNRYVINLKVTKYRKISNIEGRGGRGKGDREKGCGRKEKGVGERRERGGERRERRSKEKMRKQKKPRFYFFKKLSKMTER
jgi:hypothetical protein